MVQLGRFLLRGCPPALLKAAIDTPVCESRTFSKPYPFPIKGGPKPPNIGGPDRLVEKFETQIYSTWTFASQAQLFQI